jgi:hypothetical protein
MSTGHQHENPYAGQGSVLLDIGGDVGALVVAMPPTMVGTEIEIALTGPHGQHHGHRAHVAVVARPVVSGTVPSLVFADLVEGSYGLYGKGEDTLLMTAGVKGGEVTFVDWPVSTPV